MEQPPDNIAHEQQRDQHGDERERQRDKREADLRSTFERRLQRRIALLPVARDIFQHHDGIIDDEARRDRQRHQRQDIERIAGQIHHAKRPDERQRHGNARDDRGGDVAQKQKRHEHHEEHGENKFVLNRANRGADTLGPIREHSDVDGSG